MAPRRKAPRRRAKKSFNVSAIELGHRIITVPVYWRSSGNTNCIKWEYIGGPHWYANQNNV